MNPCSVEQIFKRIKQFGFHGRQGGGVCAVEMALWDLTGKAYNTPCYQLLGGKYRDTIRLYADTPEEEDPDKFVAKLKDRLQGKGFTFLKMDLGIELIKNIPGTIELKFYGCGKAMEYGPDDLWSNRASFHSSANY